MGRSIQCLIHTALLTLAVWPPQAIAATVPAGFAETLVAGSLSHPASMAFAPDGRLFVCLQGGQVRVIKNGALLPTPFVTLTVDFFGEHGLLGIAFDPNFVVNQYVYIHYTATTPTSHNRISRFMANGDVAVAGSETIRSWTAATSAAHAPSTSPATAIRRSSSSTGSCRSSIRS